MSLRSHMGTFIAMRILMIMLWLHLLKALLQSAIRLITAVGVLESSVLVRIKSISLIRAWEQDAPGTAN